MDSKPRPLAGVIDQWTIYRDDTLTNGQGFDGQGFAPDFLR
jgi:hypothetical protein